VGDIFHQQRRLWVRLHKKGGKFHEMPCHHTLESYLAEYMDRARLAEAGRAQLFQAIKHRPYGRGHSASRRTDCRTEERGKGRQCQRSILWGPVIKNRETNHCLVRLLLAKWATPIARVSRCLESLL
jgi:hypothetical protein